jgi:hypothetical protein
MPNFIKACEEWIIGTALVKEGPKSIVKYQPSGECLGDGERVDVSVSIPELPPNVFRKETGQPIPVAMNSGGKIVEKRVKYQPRRK